MITEIELRDAIKEVISEAWNNPGRRNTWGEFRDSATDSIMSLIKATCWLKGEQELPPTPSYARTADELPTLLIKIKAYEECQRIMLLAGFQACREWKEKGRVFRW